MDTTSGRAEVPAIGNRQMLVDHVFEAILSLLLDDGLPTGSALNIDGLAKQFNVSSTPVREALARLEATGMIRREALRGYKVAPAPTASDIGALLVTRQVLEPAIARIACENVSPDLVADLEQFNTELDTSQLGGDTFAGYRAYWKADEMFHRRIAECTGNEFLLRAYNSVEGHIQRFRLLVHNDMSGEHTVREHQAIIAAFQANDAERARTAMSEHIDGIKSRSSNLAIFSDTEDAGRN
ncbi:GntR family transcriptional regulator [Arthrobacter sp. ISL-48]|uniref:GntR family transcriptional regulator n=1 Tax=Arthrobacter sp. ISL-48 TaxID=2819110 RepID=UPI001BE76576|nr:GntR family transcriptional regulator [Arthrobacter sp. ISL-48]MBT2532924.1 GntR family transcriptional regulator [Arthrobacter sp. ISL-48]